MIIIDDLKRSVDITSKPERVISLIPSITETLISFGLEKEIIAVTNFCNLPPEVTETKEKIGGPKHLNIDKIISLKPDLVIANAEENEKEEIEILEKNNIKIFVTFPKNVDDAINMMKKLSLITWTKEKADIIINKIEKEYYELKNKKKNEHPFKVLNLIWKNPFMSVSGDTFIGDMLKIIKGKNIFEKSEKRYFNVHIEEIIKEDPEVIILPSEPYKFSKEDTLEIKSYQEISAVKNDRIFLLDGEIFSWYGVHLLESFKFLKKFKFV